MSVVSNTGPLISLAGIGRLDLLRELFGTITIPVAVKAELEAGGTEAPGANSIAQSDRIFITPLSHPTDAILESLLDAGEAAAIALARELKADVILIDESKARKIAREIYGINVVGTGRILIEAKARGLITDVRPFIFQMRENGYWLSDRLVAEILRQARE